MLERTSIALTILSAILVHGDTCGKRLVNHEALIVNGYKSKEGDFPWHASILHVEINQNIQYKCGGTLLNKNSILTAAHCVYENGRPIVADRVLVQLGRHNLKISGTHSQEIEAYQTLPHHDFNASSLSNDIAIIRLATEVTFNNYVQPICLWESDKADISEVVGKFGTVVGFGITEKNKVSYTLRQAVIPVVSLTACLDSDRSFYGNFLSDKTFCAGFQNGTTACNGDSGGSLTIEENGVHRIRGIVSLTQVRPGNNKRLCKTDQYVVFTDVAKYLSWIRELIPGLPSPSTAKSLIAELSADEVDYCYFLNNDLTNARLQRDECRNRCAYTPRCTHFTWTNHNDGTCWMKQGKVTKSDVHNSLDKMAVCGIVENNHCNIRWNGNDWAYGCEFWQNDLDNVRSSSHDCNQQCASTEGCTHYTWTDYNGGTCWLKQNAVGKQDAFLSNKKSTICGITKKIAWNGNKWAFGCDFRGNDINHTRSIGEDCGSQCASDPKCTHFTWNNAFGGTCWMKEQHGVSKDDALVTSDMSVCGIK